MFELTERHVRLGALAATRESAIRQAGDLLVSSELVGEGYIDSMIRREAIASTYLCNGVAIPHGLSRDSVHIRKTGIVVLQCPQGVEWDERCRVSLVVAIAAKTDEHLAVLARLSEVLSDDTLAVRLATAEEPRPIVEALGGIPGNASSIGPEESGIEDGCTENIRVCSERGLHARPASVFANLARRYHSKISVRSRGHTVDGKSMAALLQLGANFGDVLTISAIGADAREALRCLRELLERPEDATLAQSARSHDWVPGSSSRTLSGLSASPGLAVGHLHVVGTVQYAAEDPAVGSSGEQRRFGEALALARRQLAQLYQRSVSKLGLESAAILLAHTELLADEDLSRKTGEMILSGSSAARAWMHVMGARIKAFESSSNGTLRGRAIDLQDLMARVLRNLGSSVGQEPTTLFFAEPTILIAPELTPSQTVELDSSTVVGVCTSGGGIASHSSILARSLGIPVVVGAGTAALRLENGQVAIIDGDSGVLYVSPTPADIVTAGKASRRIVARNHRDNEDRFKPALTSDSWRVNCFANIGDAGDIATALENGAEGVGLLRTEFLFTNRQDPPSEDEQYEIYRAMLQSLDGLPLTLRTLDIGGDKSIPYLPVVPEANPFLGVRGIRLSFRNKEIFTTQLRAAYRASAHGTLRLMFPMIATPEEASAARGMAEEIRRALGVDGVDIGCMIEVPSAVMMAPELAFTMDFFSIGTNDLTQYVLAVDRGNAALAGTGTALHPAVLRMIDRIVRAASDRKRPVSVCGGLAGDPLGAEFLVGLGVSALSMPSAGIPGIKARIRSVSRTDLAKRSERALLCGNESAVRNLFGQGEART